jgi:alginate production protein
MAGLMGSHFKKMGLLVQPWSVGFGVAMAFFVLSWPLFANEGVQPKEKQTPSSEKSGEEVADIDAPPSTPTRIAPNVFFGGRIEFEYEVEYNYDLDDEQRDKLELGEPIVSLATAIVPNQNIMAFVNLRFSDEFEFEAEGRNKRNRPPKLKVSQAYISLNNALEDARLTLGRQRFEDDREWVYDEKLDAVRLSWALPRLTLDASFSFEGVLDKDILRGQDHGEQVFNYFVRLEYRPTKRVKVAPYCIFRDDRSERWVRPLFFGLHSSGRVTKRLEYWIEFAWVEGRERVRRGEGRHKIIDFDGVGLDVGGTYRLPGRLRPAVSLGFAFGEGEFGSDGKVHRGFRQTGLHDNNDKLNGITAVRYYGEVFDPELSNLMVFTVGAGIRPTKKVSAEIIYHHYWQHRAHNELKDADIDADPDGVDRELGSEFDVVVAFRDVYNFTVEATFGVFIPGKAFSNDEDESAFLASVRVIYEF